MAFAHGELILDAEGDPDRHGIINIGLCAVEELWEEALATGILDLEQPVAMLILSVLQLFRPEADGNDVGARSVARFRKLLPVGSYLALSHVTDEDIPREIAAKLVELRHMCHDHLTAEMWCRSRGAIEAMLDHDFRVLPPGWVWTPEWHPEEAGSANPLADRPSYAAVWGGVGQRIR